MTLVTGLRSALRWWQGDSRPVTLINGRVVTPDGWAAQSIRLSTHVLGLDEVPHAGDVVIDVGGAFVLPGLINAHEHLELNHYGRVKAGARYDHADDWIADLRPRLQGDAAIRRHSRQPLAERLFIGGIKNLLAGVTTVAHHNPRYPAICGAFPVGVLEHYGWAHSYAMEGQPVGANGEPGPAVRPACEATAAHEPFFVHAGEGVDARATAELQRLAADGCLRANTVIIHGVGHTVDTWQQAANARTQLVWCPASNLFLLGATVDVRALATAVPGSLDLIALGSDSRLTGSRDLLDEVRCAVQAGVTSTEALAMVTTAAARVVRQPQAGRLSVGLPADLLIVPADPEYRQDAGRALCKADRSTVHLVMRGGRPMIGDAGYAPLFAARQVATHPVRIDGVERLMERRLARRLLACPIQEPGVDVLD